MKYNVLIQISEFLSKFKKINRIKRVDDLALSIEFDGSYELIFDLNKTNSAIYKSPNKGGSKEYKAPFDITLKKRLNSAKILSIKTLENNRILEIKTTLSGSYKQVLSTLYLEFTGRFTNIILVDENGIILEALRHFSNDTRSIKVGKKLELLEPFDIVEKPSKTIENFDEFFQNEFALIKEKKLQELKKAKLLNLDKKLEILNANLQALPNKNELIKSSQELNKIATLIVANLYRLNNYDKELELEDEDGKKIYIKLENSPKISANEKFKMSKKLRQKAQNIEIQKDNLSSKINFIQKLKKALISSQSISQINTLVPKKSGNKKESKNIDLVENFYMGDFKICVGKNEKGNILLLKEAKKDDVWFHIKDIPSSHVLIKTNKQILSDEILEFAAKLCVNFTTTKSGNYLVDYTKKQNVKVANGAFVNYINYKTIGIKI